MPKPKRAPEVTQETIDTARKPLTPKEKVVYTEADREWRPGNEIGPKPVLDSLVAKDWIDQTYSVLVGCWVYRRRHNLDV